ncbi:unnamed protein product [Tilletia controversa]|uniref:Uncharacterized protein n=1 Tax=Tilletia caries TaxID=13290 RepID=A0ABN7J7C6_9BASI|nr:unnamed protein product [Tilletia controversa]CAD6956748.1 unnamed protein product [Tilletia caries]CAD6981947.1 unnamed protein product [Tilletia controversa]
MTSRPSGTAASSAAILCNAAATANTGHTAALANPSLLSNLGGRSYDWQCAYHNEHGRGHPSAGWRTSTRPFTGANADVAGTSPSAFAAAVSRFSNLARPTTLGRPPKDAVSVKIKRNTINLIPVAAWNLSMSSKGKPGYFDNFLDDQHCQINAAGIKKNFTAAEVMSFIITTFAQKGSEMKEKGFH